MDLNRVRLIAIKEIQDHITSLRFLALLFLLITICGIFLLKETGAYLQEISNYGSSQIYFIGDLPYTLNIFGGIRTAIGGSSIFGSIIAIALGFDLITKEKESCSIKAILSVPVYRDEVINGKALGGIIVIGIAVTIVFIFAFAILLLHSIVPEISELSYLFAFWLFTILFLSGIFIMSIMISAFSKKSGFSLIFSLLALLLLTSVISTAGNFTADNIFGPEPSIKYEGAEDLDYENFREDSKNYYEKKEMIYQLTSYLAINTNYHKLSRVLTRPQDGRLTDYRDDKKENYDRTLPPVGVALAPMWGYILFLIAYPVVFFGIAYVKFMRMDLK